MKDARKWTQVQPRNPRVGAPWSGRPASSLLAGRILGLLALGCPGVPLRLDARLKDRVFRLATFLEVTTGIYSTPFGGSHDRA